jgi:hypothetical protein
MPLPSTPWLLVLAVWRCAASDSSNQPVASLCAFFPDIIIGKKNLKGFSKKKKLEGNAGEGNDSGERRRMPTGESAPRSSS